MYSGISIEEFRKLRKENDGNKVVFIGRLMKYKGVDRLIESFSLVSKDLPDTELHIIGSGPEFKTLVNLAERCGIKSKVKFYGWLNRSEVLNLLASSSILVHPNVYESFCYSIVEAYALGKPVIAHRASYSMELVNGMDAGVTVNTFNRRALADSIVALLSDASLYKRLSKGHCGPQNKISALSRWPKGTLRYTRRL